MTANTFVAFSNNLTNSMFIKIAIFIMGVILRNTEVINIIDVLKKTIF